MPNAIIDASVVRCGVQPGSRVAAQVPRFEVGLDEECSDPFAVAARRAELILDPHEDCLTIALTILIGEQVCTFTITRFAPGYAGKRVSSG